MGLYIKQEDFTSSEIELLTEIEVNNPGGSYEVLEYRVCNLEFTFPNPQSLYQELSLIYGIGETTAHKLNTAGFRTFNDLVAHPRWGKAAVELIRIIKQRDVTRLAKYGASDLQLISFFSPEAIRFIDIETVGLQAIYPVFLVGMLQFKNGQGLIRQFLARDFEEEKAILWETYQELKEVALVTSFNGRSFDLPYLKGRMRFHGLTEAEAVFHFDLLHQTRRTYRGQLPNCRLLTLEQYLLNQERGVDLPGAQVAEYYYYFLDTNNPKFLSPILKHNAWDLLAMAKLLGLLTNQKAGSDNENK